MIFEFAAFSRVQEVLFVQNICFIKWGRVSYTCKYRYVLYCSSIFPNFLPLNQWGLLYTGNTASYCVECLNFDTGNMLSRRFISKCLTVSAYQPSYTLKAMISESHLVEDFRRKKKIDSNISAIFIQEKCCGADIMCCTKCKICCHFRLACSLCYRHFLIKNVHNGALSQFAF